MSDNLESSLSNLNLDFSNIKIKDSYKIPLYGKWSVIKVSNDAKYQIACQYTQNGQVFISNNYGLNWIVVQYLTDRNYIGSFTGCAISKDGKNMSVIQQNGYIAFSHDYGVKWSIIQNCLYKTNIIFIIYNMQKNWTRIDISGTGQYQTAISLPSETDKYGCIFRSDDYGTSWSDVSYNITENNYFYSDISISYSGKYQTICIQNSLIRLIISDDYGITWKNSVFSDMSDTSKYCIVNKSLNEMIDGKYQYYISNFGKRINVSGDYGNTWNSYYIVPDPEIYFTFFSLSTSSDGKYVYCSTISDNISSIIISNDYGFTWTFSYVDFAQYYSLINDSINVFQIDTSFNGSFVTLTNNDNKILFSNNYAETFVDFNDSPLYNYIYPVKSSSSGKNQISIIPNDSIIISNNNGISWNKIDINKNWCSCSISLTGQYQCVIDQSSLVYISYDYGQTWTYNIQLSTGKIIKVSGDGKIYIVINTESVNPKYYISNDYGKTFIDRDQFSVPFFTPSNIGISLSGKYQTITSSLSPPISTSNDYGITFTPFMPFSDDVFLIGCDNISMSSNGKFQLVTTNFQPFYFVTSNDYGENWTIRDQLQSNIISVEDCIVSSTGQYQFMSIYTNPNIYIYYSIDYGNNWSIMNTQSINYSCQLSSVSSTGQCVTLSNQNSIYQIYLNSINKK